MVTSLDSNRICGKGYQPTTKMMRCAGENMFYPSSFHACERRLVEYQLEHDGPHKCDCGLIFTDDEAKAR
jgi:hypothetical protein